jgi:hypothetical protein
VHTEEFHVLSSDIIKRDDLKAGHVTRLGKRRNACVGLVGKHEGRSPLGRPRRRLEDNIKIELERTEFRGDILLMWLRMRSVRGLL